MVFQQLRLLLCCGCVDIRCAVEWMRAGLWRYVSTSLHGGKCSDWRFLLLNDVKWWTPQGRTWLARPGHKWEDNINMDIEDSGIGQIWLRIWTSGGLLWTRQRTLGFHKIRGIFWLVEELSASKIGSTTWCWLPWRRVSMFRRNLQHHNSGLKD